MAKKNGKLHIGISFFLLFAALFAPADLSAQTYQETVEEQKRQIEKLNRDIEQLSQAIEKNPSRAENYLRRGELYIEMSNAMDAVGYLPLAHGVADFSKYLRLNPRNVDAYHLRADARFDLFIGYNPFSIADLEKSVRLVPGDLETKDTLRNARREYRTLISSKECRGTTGAKSNQRNYPTTELFKVLRRIKDSSEKSNADKKRALELMACGANVNYVNPRTSETALSDLAQLPIPLVVGLLEAGANPNAKDKNGNTAMLKMLDSIIKNKNQIDDAMFERIKIVLDYGANPNLRNRNGQNTLSLIRKAGNQRLIDLLIKRRAK